MHRRQSCRPVPEAGEIEIIERAILIPAAGARPDTFAIAMERPAERRERLVARIAQAPCFRRLAALRFLRVVDGLLFRRDFRRLLDLLHVARMQRLLDAMRYTACGTERRYSAQSSSSHR